MTWSEHNSTGGWISDCETYRYRQEGRRIVLFHFNTPIAQFGLGNVSDREKLIAIEMTRAAAEHYKALREKYPPYKKLDSVLNEPHPNPKFSEEPNVQQLQTPDDAAAEQTL